MKIKGLFFSLVLLAMGGSLLAQRPLTIVGGVVTANVTDYNDFAVTLSGNVTGVTLSTTVTPATGYQVTMRFVQDATGSRTVTFGGNITSSCSINATALSVTICRWQYTASGNTWADVVSSSPSSSSSPTCAATTNFPMAATFITDFFLNLNCNVTTSVMTGNLVAGNEAVFTLTQDSTGGRTFAWPTGFLNTPTLNGVAGGTTVATFQYCGTVGNGNACPANSWQNTDVGPAGPPPNKNAIDGNNPAYGLFWDTVLLCDGVTASGSPNFSSASATFTAADIGKTLKATSSGVACGENQATSSIKTISGLITTITDAHHVVLDTNAVGTAASGATFAYGHLDDVGLTAMETACKAQLNPCKYILPAGLGMMNNQHFNDKTAVNATQQTIGAQVTGYSGPDIGGSATGSTGIVLGPAFVPANCTGGASSNRCMGGMWGATFHDFFIHGVCDMRTGQTDNVFWFGTGYSDSVDRVNLRCYGVQDTGFGALNTDALGGKIPNLIVDGFSRTGLNLSSGTLNSTYGAITVADLAAGPFITVGGTGTLTAQELIIYFGAGAGTNTKGVVINGGSTLQVQNIQVTENLGTNAAQGISNSGTVYLLGGQIDASGNTIGQAFQNLTGGKAYIANTSFKGGATGQDIFNLTGATLTDLGGNVPLQGRVIAQTGSIWNGPAVFKGSCSGVGTAASTLGLYGLGQNAALTCTSTTVNLGKVATVAGTAYDLVVSATAAGTNASSGVVTVLKNGAAQTMTCTIGTGTSCVDSAHTFTFVAGDVISVQFTTQAADTLAGVTGTVVTM